MRSTKARWARKAAVMSVAALLFAGGLAAALSGCGSTTPAGVAPQVVTGGQSTAAQPDVTSPPAEVEQPVADEPAAVEEAPVPAPSALPAGTAVEEAEANDCPLYDDGICTRTGEPCTDCR